MSCHFLGVFLSKSKVLFKMSGIYSDTDYDPHLNAIAVTVLSRPLLSQHF